MPWLVACGWARYLHGQSTFHHCIKFFGSHYNYVLDDSNAAPLGPAAVYAYWILQ